MAPLTVCPHCDTDLPAVQDAFCPDCGGELPPEGEEAPLRYKGVEVAAPPAPRRPTPASAEPAPAPEAKKPAEEMSPGVSMLLSLFIAMMLGASVEFMNHGTIAAKHGNAFSIGLVLAGAVVIHLIRVFPGKGDRHGTGFALACVVLVIALYTHYDEKWFAARRPWNLVLATLFLAGGAVLLTGYVFALLRMFEGESERAMGKTCLGLGPAGGLGLLLAMGWGWRALFRDDSPVPAEKKDRHFHLMCAWTAGLVVQLAILGYVWYKAPPGRGLVPVIQEPPITLDTQRAGHDGRGAYYRVRVVNTSDRPLYMKWAVFPGEEWRVKEDKRPLARWTAMGPIPPGRHEDLLVYAGLIIEFDAGELGVKVHEVPRR